MATAELIYVDPSALTRLYFLHPGSREMAAWRFKTKGPLPVTHHGRLEIVNAIARAVFAGYLKPDEAERAWRRLDEDFASGHLVQADLLWRSAMVEARKLAKRHSPVLGTRAMDVLHVACALELKLLYFLSFDVNQNSLAAKVGLKLVRL